jgi:hypothetical protein
MIESTQGLQHKTWHYFKIRLPCSQYIWRDNPLGTKYQHTLARVPFPGPILEEWTTTSSFVQWSSFYTDLSECLHNSRSRHFELNNVLYHILRNFDHYHCKLLFRILRLNSMLHGRNLDLYKSQFWLQESRTTADAAFTTKLYSANQNQIVNIWIF